MAALIIEDSHFVLYDHGDELIVGVCVGDWDVADVERLISALQPRIDSSERPRFVMDLHDMQDITLAARYQTALFMRHNRGRIVRTGVVTRDGRQQFTLRTLLRVARRTNVDAFATRDEAIAYARADIPLEPA